MGSWDSFMTNDKPLQARIKVTYDITFDENELRRKYSGETVDLFLKLLRGERILTETSERLDFLLNKMLQEQLDHRLGGSHRKTLEVVR